MSFIDCNHAIVYNGHTSVPIAGVAGGGPVSGCVMRSAGPYAIPVDVRSDKLPLADGSTLSDAYLAGRTLQLHGEVWAATPGGLQDGIDDWVAAYSPRSPSLLVSAPLQFSRETADISTWATSQIPLYMTCSPIREPWHAEVSRKEANSLVMDIYAQLFAPDPYQYVDQARQIITLGTSATTLPYRGNAPSYGGVEAWIMLSATPGPVITLVVNSAYSRADLGYSSISIDTSGLSASVLYKLSWANKEVTASGVKNGVLGSSTIFGAITPGATASYAVVSGTGGNLSYVKLLYPEAFF